MVIADHVAVILENALLHEKSPSKKCWPKTLLPFLAHRHCDHRCQRHYPLVQQCCQPSPGYRPERVMNQPVAIARQPAGRT